MLRCVLKRYVFYNCTKLMHLRYINSAGESSGGGDPYNQATLLTGGLDKFQGRLKEEQYFVNENNKLIVKMKEQQNATIERSPEIHLTRTLQEPRDMACAPSKHKNYPEEIFFLNEQTECTKRLSDRLNDEANITDQVNMPKDDTSIIIENEVQSTSNK